MGVFDSVYFKCPHCGLTQEEQFKPGGMKSYDFPEDAQKMPLDHLNWFQDRQWTCFDCKKPFRTDVRVELKISGAKIY